MDKINESMTNSAKYALDDILHEYRENLLEEAYMYSSSDKHGNKEISLKDIYYAKDRIERSLINNQPQQNKKKRFYYILALSGIMYSMIGAIIFIIQNSVFDIQKDLGIILSVVGLFITIYSYILYKLKDQSENNQYKELYLLRHHHVDDFLVVKLWAQIEKLGLQLMSIDNYEAERRNITSIISYLNLIFETPGDNIKLKEIKRKKEKLSFGNHK